MHFSSCFGLLWQAAVSLARDDDYGWRRDATFEAQWDLKKCDLLRLSAPSLRDLKALGRPAVFRNPRDNAQLRKAFSRANVLRNCAETAIFYGASSDVASNTPPIKTTFRQYIEEVMRWPQEEPMYAFNAGGVLEACEKTAREAGRTGESSAFASSYLKPWAPGSGLNDAGRNALIFAIGASGNGIPFHAHYAAYNELLVGAKRWAIYSPQAYARVAAAHNFAAEVTHASHQQWLARTLPRIAKAADRPLQCVQRPGDVIFVPAGWSHATLTMGETLGVAQMVPEIEAIVLDNKVVGAVASSAEL